MAAQQFKLRKPIERLANDEWNPCPHKSEKDSLEWEHHRFRFRLRPQRHRVRQRGRNRIPAVYPRIATTSLHSAKCNPKQSNSVSEDEFNSLADYWERETRNMTSPKSIVRHPAVHEIVLMGDEIVPMILRRMASRPWFWFGILMELTKETTDPIDQSMRGDMQRMTEAWLKWGADRAII